MARPLYVSEDKWRDGIKYLMGLGANPTLTRKDSDAQIVLRDGMGWEKQR